MTAAYRTIAGEVVDELARLQRPSASDGEHRAAGLIRDRLRRLGHGNARVELERAHGSLWLPILVTSAAALWGSLLGRRRGAAICLAAAAAAADDLDGNQTLRRRLLPRRRTANVVAEVKGERSGDSLVVLLAHHDAARSSVLFQPRLLRWSTRPYVRKGTTPPMMWPIVAAPALGLTGSLLGSRTLRRAAALLSGSIVALMVENALGDVVPGANDNLSGVAVLIAVAQALADRSLTRTDVLLVSTGAEEAGLEGARGFFARHGESLRRRGARVVCVDTVGARDLVVIAGEGTLRVRPYSDDLRRRVLAAARAVGHPIDRELVFRGATDGAVALRHELDAVALASLDGDAFPSTYHWPTDSPENLDYNTVADAAALCVTLLEDLDRS